MRPTLLTPLPGATFFLFLFHKVLPRLIRLIRTFDEHTFITAITSHHVIFSGGGKGSQRCHRQAKRRVHVPPPELVGQLHLPSYLIRFA